MRQVRNTNQSQARTRKRKRGRTPDFLLALKVTDFVHYRDLLAALYKAGKDSTVSYSYEKLAEDLGLPASNVLWLVSTGRRKLSEKNGIRIAKALDLKGIDRQYLLKLITYNNARKVDLRESAFQELMALKNRELPSAEQQQGLEYFAEWYHPVIRELVGLDDFQSDPDWIGERLMFKVLPNQIRSSLELLESLGLIEMDKEKGRYVQTGGQVHPDRKVGKIAAIRYHQKICEISKEAVTRVPSQRRDFNAMTISISEEAAKLLQKKLLELCDEVMKADREASERTQVYQVNLQIFPFTKE